MIVGCEQVQTTVNLRIMQAEKYFFHIYKTPIIIH